MEGTVLQALAGVLAEVGHAEQDRAGQAVMLQNGQELAGLAPVGRAAISRPPELIEKERYDGGPLGLYLGRCLLYTSDAADE